MLYSIFQKWQKFSQTNIPYTVKSDGSNLIKLVLTSIVDFEWTKKELQLIFLPNQV